MKKGFTLIELLVVTSIISLLSSVVLYSVSDARVKAQDTKKIEEVRQVALAMELRKDGGGGSLLGSEYSNNQAYVETSAEYQTAMSNLVSSGSISQTPRSEGGTDYFYIQDTQGNGVFGAILRSGDAIDQNEGGCEFSDDDYSCDSDSGKTYVYDRVEIVSTSQGCEDCEDQGVGSTGGGGSDSNWSLVYSHSNFYPARTICDNLSYGGNDDWRLPTVSELIDKISDLDNEGEIWTDDFASYGPYTPPSLPTTNTSYYYTVDNGGVTRQRPVYSSPQCDEYYQAIGLCHEVVCTR